MSTIDGIWALLMKRPLLMAADIRWTFHKLRRNAVNSGRFWWISLTSNISSLVKLWWQRWIGGWAARTSSSFASATRNIGRSDQKNKNCSDLVCWYLRMVEEPIWKDFVLGGHLLVYWGGQSWHKFEFFWFKWNFNSEKWKVAIFVVSYLKIPGYTWADTYFGNQGDAKDHFYTSFMRY